MLRALIFGTLLVVVHLLSGQQIPMDSNEVNHRFYDEEELAEYKSQKVFNYDQDPKYERNIFRKWWYTFLRKVSDALGQGGASILWMVFRIALIGITVYFIIRYLLRATGTKVFRKEDKSPDFDARYIKSESGEKDILISLKEAEDAEDVETALRLRFLLLLRNLDKSGIIDWKDYKTNSDYYREISEDELRHEFRRLSNIFEQVVYGDFEMPLTSYLQVKKRYEAFNHNLKVS